MTSQIDPKCATAFILNYQNGLLDPNSLQSVLLNSEIIAAIKAGMPGPKPTDPPVDYTGLRVYIARYCANCNATDSQGNACVVPATGDGALTTIVSLTLTDANGTEVDMAFFDYGNTCPPSCNGSITR